MLPVESGLNNLGSDPTNGNYLEMRDCFFLFLPLNVFQIALKNAKKSSRCFILFGNLIN